MRKILFLLFLVVNLLSAQTPIKIKLKTNKLFGSPSSSPFIQFSVEGDAMYSYVNADNPAVTGNGLMPSGTFYVDVPISGQYIFSIVPSDQFKLKFSTTQQIVLEEKNSEADRVLELSQWGNGQWKPNLNSMFKDCKNMIITATDIPNFSNVTNMNSMFWGFSQNLIPNITSWNVSKVKDFSMMFAWSKFNTNLNGWNTASATNVYAMFSNASVFNQNLDNWKTENVTNMSSMFSNATLFNGNISSWNTAKVTDMSFMFSNATSFNNNIRSWNTINVNVMSGMFRDASSFNQNIGIWNVSKVYGFDFMFMNASSFNQSLGNWKIYAKQPFNSLPADLNSMFNYSGLDCVKYGNTLQGWSQNPDTQKLVHIGVSGIKYNTTGKNFRDNLMNSKNWQFYGDFHDPNCSALSVNDFNLDNIKIENPASDSLNIQNLDNITKIEIYSTEGRLVKILNKGQRNISELTKGLYTLKLFTSEKTIVKKIIKK